MATKKTDDKGDKKAAAAKNAVLSLGDPAPDFEAPDESGKKHRLADYKGKTLVLFFYKKDDTPGCTQEACDFKDNHAKIVKKGALVLGVSSDSPNSHKGFKAKHGLPYSLLSDEKHAIA